MIGGRFVIGRDGGRLVLLRPDPRMAEPPGAVRLDAYAVRYALAALGSDGADEMRAAFRAVAPEGGAAASFEVMSDRLCAEVARGGVRAYRVSDAGGGAPGTRLAAFKPGDEAAVPFVDDAGKAVLNQDGKPMLRPAGLPPELFVSQGRADDAGERGALPPLAAARTCSA